MDKDQYSCKKLQDGTGICKLGEDLDHPRAWVKFTKNKDESISVVDTKGTDKDIQKLLDHADRVVRKGVRQASRQQVPETNPGEFS